MTMLPKYQCENYRQNVRRIDIYARKSCFVSKFSSLSPTMVYTRTDSSHKLSGSKITTRKLTGYTRVQWLDIFLLSLISCKRELLALTEQTAELQIIFT